MSEAADKLARSRLAILEHVARRHRRHDPHPPGDDGYGPDEEAMHEEPPPPGAGWVGRVQHALRTWWRYHPAHMAVELATPALRSYARARPGQLLGISAAAGAAIMLTRPWRLISLTTLVVAVVKSSQLSNVLMSALSAADFAHDQRRPEWEP